MSFVSIGIIAASLALFGIFLIVEKDINSILDKIEDQCYINVYISRNAEGTDLNRILDDLRKIPNISEIRFFSKEERIEKAKQTIYKGKEYLLDDFDNDNPLRDSYIITANNLEKSKEISDAAEKIQGIEEVINFQEIVDKTEKAAGVIRKIGGVIILFLALIAMFIIANTIKLGLIYRQNEIEIMRFVGASDTYICGPFVTEGLLLGILGAVLASAAILVGYAVFIGEIGDFVQLDFITLPGVYEILPSVVTWFMSIGIGIGTIGSCISIRKYLRV